ERPNPLQFTLIFFLFSSFLLFFVFRFLPFSFLSFLLLLFPSSLRFFSFYSWYCLLVHLATTTPPLCDGVLYLPTERDIVARRVAHGDGHLLPGAIWRPCPAGRPRRAERTPK
ncbi:hypothetical protein Tsubulata_016316, partial [Turnera subulata]